MTDHEPVAAADRKVCDYGAFYQLPDDSADPCTHSVAEVYDHDGFFGELALCDRHLRAVRRYYEGGSTQASLTAFAEEVES